MSMTIACLSKGVAENRDIPISSMRMSEHTPSIRYEIRHFYAILASSPPALLTLKRHLPVMRKVTFC